jgi:excisionase family DNA binding protein
MRANATAPPDRTTARATYTTEEAATRAGLHPDTLRAAATRGEFPAPLRIGGKLLWPRAAVDAFLSGTGIRTAAGISGGETVRTAAVR